MRTHTTKTLMHSKLLIRTLALSALLLSFRVSELPAHPGHTAESTESAQPPVIVVEFMDFHSNPCAEVTGLMHELAAATNLKFQTLFKHTPSHPDALAAHEAALAAGQQGKFWEMHDLLFGQSKPMGSSLVAMAKSLDLDIGRFQKALDEREFRDQVMRQIAEARGLGVTSTPTVFVNGTKLEGLEQIKAFVSEAISPTPAASAPPAIEDLPTEELHLDLAGSPSSGPVDAPVTIIEYSAFHCGFCSINSRTLNALATAYPGKIRRVFKQFPIKMDASGMLPHQASMAAMDQGKFWEMYESLMARPLEGREDLIERARTVGLDVARLRDAISARELHPIVQRDIAEGDALGIRATPTTFINGKRLVGRQSLEYLSKFVDSIVGVAPGTAGAASESDVAGAGIDPSAMVVGPHDASAWVEVFVDFGDPDAATTAAALNAFREERSDVRIQFRHFPTDTDAAVLRTHEASMAAAAQGKFWEMRDLIISASAPIGDAQLLAFARKLKLDTKRFTAALEDRRFTTMIAADVAEARKRGLDKSALFLNDVRFDGVPSVSDLTRLMDENTCCGKAAPPLAARAR